MPKHRAALILMFFSTLSLLCSTSLFNASAQETNLVVDPSSLSGLEIGDTFQINITVSNVVDLSSWEFKLSYSNIINLTGYAEGPFLKSHPDPNAHTFFGSAFKDTSYVYNTTHMYKFDEYGDQIIFSSTYGAVHLFNTLLEATGGVNGSGTLATITFKVLAEGSSPLPFDPSWTKLLDSHVPFGNLIPHTLTGGVVHVGLHDVAITNTITSKTIAADTIVYINVTVENQGRPPETFDIAAYYNSNLIETKTISDLPSGSNILVTFAWDTTPVPKGNYTISAVASIIPGETETEDNTHIDGQVQETIPGDVTGDGKVNILDVSKVAKAFQATEADPKWDPNVDLDNNGVINIVDISRVAKEFGKVDP